MRKGKNTDKRITLFVGGLAFSVSEYDLKLYFEQFAVVLKVTIPRDPTKGISKGYGFVTIKDSPWTQQIVSQRNMIAGRRIECEVASKKSEKTISKDEKKRRKLYISRIPFTLTDAEFENFFNKFGLLRNCYIIKSADSNKNKPYGYVEYEDPSSAEEVLKLKNELRIKGVKIAVSRFKGKEEQNKNNMTAENLKDCNSHLEAPDSEPEDDEDERKYQVLLKLPDSDIVLQTIQEQKLELPLNDFDHLKVPPKVSLQSKIGTPCSSKNKMRSNRTFSTINTPTNGIISPSHSPFNNLGTSRFAKTSIPLRSPFCLKHSSSLMGIEEENDIVEKVKIERKKDESSNNYCFRVCHDDSELQGSLDPNLIWSRESIFYDQKYGVFRKNYIQNQEGINEDLKEQGKFSNDQFNANLNLKMNAQTQQDNSNDGKKIIDDARQKLQHSLQKTSRKKAQKLSNRLFNKGDDQLITEDRKPQKIELQLSKLPNFNYSGQNRNPIPIDTPLDASK